MELDNEKFMNREMLRQVLKGKLFGAKSSWVGVIYFSSTVEIDHSKIIVPYNNKQIQSSRTF